MTSHTTFRKLWPSFGYLR